MLQFRAQRLQEEEAKTKALTDMIGSISKGVSGVAGAFQQAGKDQSANQLMNQISPPSATAVDPAMQSKFTGQAGTPYRGGEAQLEQLMKVKELESKIASARGLDAYRQAQGQQAQAGLGYRAREVAVREAAEARLLAKESDANQQFQKLGPAAKEIFQASKGYQAGISVLEERMQKAIQDGDKDAYDRARRDAVALNEVHQSKKLTQPLRDIPVWVSPDQRMALKEMETATSPQDVLSAQQGAQGMFMPRGDMPPPTPQGRMVSPELVNRAMEPGAQVTPEEANQIVPRGAAAPLAGRAAPGVAPPIRRNPQTGASVIWDSKAGQWLPYK